MDQHLLGGFELKVEWVEWGAIEARTRVRSAVADQCRGGHTQRSAFQPKWSIAGLAVNARVGDNTLIDEVQETVTPMSCGRPSVRHRSKCGFALNFHSPGRFAGHTATPVIHSRQWEVTP